MFTFRRGKKYSIISVIAALIANLSFYSVVGFFILFPIFLLSWVFLLIFLGITGYQIVTYLDTAQWNSVSVIDALVRINVEWAKRPTSWRGVHEIMSFVPAGLISFFLALPIFYFEKAIEKLAEWGPFKFEEAKDRADD